MCSDVKVITRLYEAHWSTDNCPPKNEKHVKHAHVGSIPEIAALNEPSVHNSHTKYKMKVIASKRKDQNGCHVFLLF